MLILFIPKILPQLNSFYESEFCESPDKFPVCLKWDITHHMKWQNLTNKVINVNTFHSHQMSKGTE